MSAPANQQPDWLEPAYFAFVHRPFPPPPGHAHEHHPTESYVTLARHREVLAYRLLALGDVAVEEELTAVEAYLARFERLRLAKEEEERQAVPQDRSEAGTYSADAWWPNLEEMAGLSFCATCQRLGNRLVAPSGLGWPITVTPGADILGVVEEYDPLRERGRIRDDWGRLVPFWRGEVLMRQRVFPGDRVAFSRARHPEARLILAVGIVPVALVPRLRKRHRRRAVASPTPAA